MALTDNLVSFWELEETSGTRNDAHSTNHLTDNNTVTVEAGIVGAAASFTTLNMESLSHASNTDLQCGDIDFTLSAWVYLPSTGITASLVTKDSTAGRDYTLDTSTGSVRFYISGGISSGDIVTRTFSSGWTHAVAMHTAATSEIMLVLNDASPSTNTAPSAPPTSTSLFMLGAREYVGFEDFFDGRLDQVGLWKRALSSSEITQLYNGGAGLSYAAMSGGGGSTPARKLRRGWMTRRV
jgi:hypothetical protein